MEPWSAEGTQASPLPEPEERKQASYRLSPSFSAFLGSFLFSSALPIRAAGFNLKGRRGQKKLFLESLPPVPDCLQGSSRVKLLPLSLALGLPPTPPPLLHFPKSVSLVSSHSQKAISGLSLSLVIICTQNKGLSPPSAFLCSPGEEHFMSHSLTPPPTLHFFFLPRVPDSICYQKISTYHSLHLEDMFNCLPQY